MNLKNYLDFQKKNKKFILDNHINYDKDTDITLPPQSNKKMNIGNSKLTHNPVLNQGEIYSNNRVDNMLRFVKQNLNRNNEFYKRKKNEIRSIDFLANNEYNKENYGVNNSIYQGSNTNNSLNRMKMNFNNPIVLKK